MNTILIYGNNKISSFLHTAFGESGLLTIDITEKINSLEDPKDIYAILDVSNAEISLDESSDLIHNTLEIKELIDLAAKVNSPYIFLYREREETHPESTIVTALDLIKTYTEKKAVKYSTVQIEDIYGSELNTSRKLEEFINSITSGSNILTVDADDNEHYLLHQKDFTSGLKEIIKILNNPSSKSKHYTLYPEDPIPEIELAHFLKEIIDFELEITYTHEEIISPALPNAEVSYPENWVPNIEFEEGIKLLLKENGVPLRGEDDEIENFDDVGAISSEIENPYEDNSRLIDPFDKFDDEKGSGFNDYDYNEEENRRSEDTYEKLEEELSEDPYAYVDSAPIKTKRASNPKTKKAKKAVAALSIALLVALSLPSLMFAYNATAGVIYVKKAASNIQKMDLNSAYSNSDKANTYFSKLEKIPFPIDFIASRFGISSKDQHLAIETSKEISLAINYLSGIDLYATFKNIDSQELAMNSNPEVLGASTVAAPEYIDKSLEKIDKVENNFETLETRNKFIRDFINQNINSLNKNRDKLTKIRNIEPVLSEILGYKSPQTYLLLIQNLNASRSSGGEVEVYGILKAENGTFSIAKLEKSENSHEQIDLNGKIPAPDAIRSITKQDYLYMEDVTWDPDFRNASKTAIDLYSYIGDEKLDGVIAIDTNLLQTFIKTVGEIKVGEKAINEQNFVASLTKNQRADVIKAVFSYVFDTFKNNPESFKTLEPMIYSALNNRSMMVYHKDESVYSSVIENDWGGVLKGNDSDDFLYFANNNLTDIPSQKIATEVSYSGKLPNENDGYTRTVEIKYTNNGDSDYLDHLMAIVPGDTLINTAKLISPGGEKNIARSVKSSQYGTKTLYEADLYIPAQQSVTLSVEYGSPPKTYKDKYMDITLQKQPGSTDSPLSIKLDGDTSSNSTLILDTDKELKFPL